MHIEDFKTWHWMVAGVIVGLLFGVVTLVNGTAVDNAGIDTIDIGRFDRAATGIAGNRHDENGLAGVEGQRPFISSLVVHPMAADEKKKAYWLTGYVLSGERVREDPKDEKSKTVIRASWREFRYQAPVPYQSEAGTFTDVMAYLDSLKKNPTGMAASYRYGWWDDPAPTLLLPAGAGLLIIGIAWPMGLGLMQGAGLAKRPEPKKAKLPKSRKAAKAHAAVDHSADNARLDDLNTQLEEGLAAGASARGPAGTATATAEAPIKMLAGGPATDAVSSAAAAAEQERLIREYGGEFYPVVKSVHKEGEPAAEKKKPGQKPGK